MKRDYIMNYLSVNVLRSDYDATNGGISSDISLNLVVPCVDGNITDEDLDDDYYTLLLPQAATLEGYPIRFKQDGDDRWLMFGGNFVYSSDSRFAETYGNSPLAIHDRYEG